MGNTAVLGSASRDWCRVRGAGADARGVERCGAALSRRHGGRLRRHPVCELRRAHPRWGPYRLVHELRRLEADPLQSRSAGAANPRGPDR
jgi:hypothetical protein